MKFLLLQFIDIFIYFKEILKVIHTGNSSHIFFIYRYLGLFGPSDGTLTQNKYNSTMLIVLPSFTNNLIANNR